MDKTVKPKFRKSKQGFNNTYVYDLGCRFRSKFEWYVAKRLIKAGIKWEFEPRVKLQNSYCLPDFYLSDYKLFLELRPSKLIDDKLMTKVRLLKKIYEREVVVIANLKGAETFIKKLMTTKEHPMSRINEVWIFTDTQGHLKENKLCRQPLLTE